MNEGDGLVTACSPPLHFYGTKEGSCDGDGAEGGLADADVVINHNDSAGGMTGVPPDGAPEDGGSASAVVGTFDDCFATRPRTTEAGGSTSSP